MNILKLTLIAGAAMVLSAAPLAAAQVQSAASAAVDANATVANHGDWTLKQREDWLTNSTEKARDDGSLDRREYNRIQDELSDIRASENALRMQHDAHQLTDNETAQLEARLDTVAHHIHWARENNFQMPW